MSERTRVQLVPIGAFRREVLHRMIWMEVEPYSWRGLGPDSTEGQIDEALSSGVLSQSLLVSSRTGGLLGLAQILVPNFRHGTAQFTGLIRSQFQGKVWPIDGFVQFLHNTFVNHPIRKIYAELPASNVSRFGRGLARFFEVEGTLKGHEWHRGEFRDVTFFGLERDAFYANRTLSTILKRATS